MVHRLYETLYEPLEIGSPSMPDVPAPGKTVAQQAKALHYQDIYRDIQAMREAEYKKDLREGEITPEFSGLAGWLHGLGQEAKEAAVEVKKNAIPLTTVAIAGIVIYFLFFKKKPKKEEEEVEVVEEVEAVPAETPTARRRRRRRRRYY
jgi:hypothetical protein